MTNVTTTLEELEFAGAMKFRFLELDEQDYGNGSGVPFSPSDANLNRFQHVMVNVVNSTQASDANYADDDNAIFVENAGTELSGGSAVTLRVVAIGR